MITILKVAAISVLLAMIGLTTIRVLDGNTHRLGTINFGIKAED